MSIVVAPLRPEDEAAVAALFDAYRTFYGIPSDPAAARAFVRLRVERDDTALFVARADGEVAGFAHLLPSIDTLALGAAWLLEDLFVAEAARRRGVGRSLLLAAETFARSTGAIRITLSTARDNVAAQRLYAESGYLRDEFFSRYDRLLA